MSYYARKSDYSYTNRRRAPSATVRYMRAKPVQQPVYIRTVKARKAYVRAPTRASSSGISRSIGAMGGSAVGGFIGGAPGAAIGRAVGSKAGDLFSKITGMGDYNVAYNTVVNPNQTPIFKNKGRSVFISHREYITDVISSATAGAFAIDSFELNPALSSTYPWLATIAQNFEQYRIHGMVFHFKSNSADALNSVNTALGTVILATQYNVLLPAFKNKQEMENYEFGCSTRPSQDVLHPVECDPKVTSFGPVFDVKLGGNDKGDDRLYCPGRFSIATVGQQGVSVNIGELWVTYDIEFFKPRMGDVASQINQWRASGGTFAPAVPFGTVPKIISESSDFSAVTITNNTINFNRGFTGKVQVTIVWNGVLTAGLQAPTTVVNTGGVTPLNTLSPNVSSWGTPPMGATSTTNIGVTLYYNVVSGGSSVFSGGVYTGMNICDIIVNTLPNTFEVYEPEDDLN